jgi:hypothetical protein
VKQGIIDAVGGIAELAIGIVLLILVRVSIIA